MIVRLWIRCLVRTLFTWMVHWGVPSDLMAVLSRNSYLNAVAAAMEGPVRGIRFPLFLQYAMLKRTNVPFRAQLELLRTAARERAFLVMIMGSGNWRISYHLLSVKAGLTNGSGFTFLIWGVIVSSVAGDLRVATKPTCLVGGCLHCFQDFIYVRSYKSGVFVCCHLYCCLAFH